MAAIPGIIISGGDIVSNFNIPNSSSSSSFEEKCSEAKHDLINKPKEEETDSTEESSESTDSDSFKS